MNTQALLLRILQQAGNCCNVLCLTSYDMLIVKDSHGQPPRTGVCSRALSRTAAP
jgi:hypothetical protein